MRHFTNRHAELVPCGTSIPPVSSHVLVHPVGVRFTWFLRGFSPVDRCRGGQRNAVHREEDVWQAFGKL